MYFEGVKFGDGVGIEVRSLMSKMLIYAHIVGLVSAPVHAVTMESAIELNEYVDRCVKALRQICRYQWLVVCSDVEVFTPDVSEIFERKCESVFGSKSVTMQPYDQVSIVRSGPGSGILRQRCWLMDLSSGRIVCVRYIFATPIYQGTVLNGSLAPADDTVSAMFEIRQCLSWCGSLTTNMPASSGWLHQQLNAWFFSPVTEDCWYRPGDSDPFKFHIDMMIEAHPQSPGANSVPILTTDGKKWIDAHRVEEIQVFRLYLTQYPFIYTIMPDDDNRVTELKEKLKKSTETDEVLQPLLLTIPTTECEQFVRLAFKKTPKHKYLRWQCARYSGEALNAWIPIKPIID